MATGGVCPGAAAPPQATGLLSMLMGLFDDMPEDVRNSLRTTMMMSFIFSIIGAIGGLIYQSWGKIVERVNHAVTRYLQTSLIFESSDKHYDRLVDYIGRATDVHTGRYLQMACPVTALPTLRTIFDSESCPPKIVWC